MLFAGTSRVKTRRGRIARDISATLNTTTIFPHFAPELFDQLAEFDGGSGGVVDPLVELQMTGILGNAVFVRNEVPKRISLRRLWADKVVCSVRGANLVFLDPAYGIEGTRLTNRHVALAEIAALRLRDRALIIGHDQSGRRSEAKFLADRIRSLGCDPVEIIRLRLSTSRFYVIADHDSAMAELIATFARKWGDQVKSYRGLAQVPADWSRKASAELRDTV